MDAMNELNVSLQHTILTVAANGWSRRRIARELGIHRGTVGRHLGLASSKPAILLTGDLALAPAAGRHSLCAPLEEIITQAVQAGLSAQRIYQDLVAAHDFGRRLSFGAAFRVAIAGQPTGCSR
jgi:IS30 family transposase